MAGDNRKSDVPVTAIPDRNRIAAHIRQNWCQTFEHVLQVGRWLIEGRFRKRDYAEYRLPFTYSWGRRLQKIATCARILDAENRHLLPDRADALHQITLLSDKLFALAVAEGVVNSRCLVVDIKAFRASFSPPGQTKRRRMVVVFDCNPSESESAYDVLDRFTEAVERLAASRFPSIEVRHARKSKELVAA